MTHGSVYWAPRVHKAVVASGARFTGPTIHFIDEEYDTGPILAQRVVPVLPGDSPAQVAARVLTEVRSPPPTPLPPSPLSPFFTLDPNVSLLKLSKPKARLQTWQGHLPSCLASRGHRSVALILHSETGKYHEVSPSLPHPKLQRCETIASAVSLHRDVLLAQFDCHICRAVGAQGIPGGSGSAL